MCCPLISGVAKPSPRVNYDWNGIHWNTHELGILVLQWKSFYSRLLRIKEFSIPLISMHSRDSAVYLLLFFVFCFLQPGSKHKSWLGGIGKYIKTFRNYYLHNSLNNRTITASGRIYFNKIAISKWFFVVFISHYSLFFIWSTVL